MALYSNWPTSWNKSTTGSTPGVLGNSLQNLPTARTQATSPVQPAATTTWAAPTLTNGMFPDQASFDSWNKALSSPVDLGASVIQGGRTGNVDRKAAYAWGKANGLIPDTDESMFSLQNMMPLIMAAGPFLSAAGAFGGAAGAGGGVAGGSGGSEAFGGASGLGSSASSGLGGASGAVGTTAGLGGMGLGGAGASLGSGGLTTGVGVGAGLQGTAAGLGMTSGSAAGGATAAKSGLGGILDKIFGPSTGAGMSTSDALLTGSLGQGLLDIITSGKQKGAGETAAGLADPFASQRGQYQTQLAALMANPDLINEDPAYKFRLKSGQDALERSNSARGYLGSGNMLMDLQQYGQQSASEEYNRQIERLMGLSGSQFGPGNASNAYLSGALPSIAQKYQGIGALGTAGREILDRILNSRGGVV